MGCSVQRVPSLSKVAIRSSVGTKSGPPGVTTRRTKETIADFAVPSFQDGNGSGCARAPLLRITPMHAARARKAVRKTVIGQASGRVS